MEITLNQNYIDYISNNSLNENVKNNIMEIIDLFKINSVSFTNNFTSIIKRKNNVSIKFSNTKLDENTFQIKNKKLYSKIDLNSNNLNLLIKIIRINKNGIINNRLNQLFIYVPKKI